MKLDLRPVQIRCPDCQGVFSEWWQLVTHWKKAWRQPRRFGMHYKPRGKVGA